MESSSESNAEFEHQLNLLWRTKNNKAAIDSRHKVAAAVPGCTIVQHLCYDLICAVRHNRATHRPALSSELATGHCRL